MLKAAPMAYFMVICAPLLIMFHVILLRPSAEFALLFHEACLSFSPASPHRSAYEAIVCGADLSLDDFARNFRVTGLLHVLVVSGSHLVFLERLLETVLSRFKWTNVLIFPALIAFSLATQLQAPVVRALLNLALARLNAYGQLRWTDVQRTTMSGLFSFAFCHDAKDAHSLLLSWGAALALASFPPSENGRSWFETLQKNAWIYVILAPLLTPMGTPHPGTILLNWLIAPFMGVVLFPASLGTFALPFLQGICDALWNLVTRLVAFCSSVLGDSMKALSIPSSALWLYLGTLTLLLLWRDVVEKRRRICRVPRKERL